jgi:hypothetical protein
VDREVLTRGSRAAQHAYAIRRALRHGTVDPGADLSRLSALDIARESRWNLNRQRQLTAAHAPVQIRVISNRRAFDEVP